MGTHGVNLTAFIERSSHWQLSIVNGAAKSKHKKLFAAAHMMKLIILALMFFKAEATLSSEKVTNYAVCQYSTQPIKIDLQRRQASKFALQSLQQCFRTNASIRVDHVTTSNNCCSSICGDFQLFICEWRKSESDHVPVVASMNYRYPPVIIR